LAHLEISTPFVSGKIETLWLSPGKSGKLTVTLQQRKPFEGPATIRLCGLPEKVSCPDREITKNDQEVEFEVTADPASRPQSFKNLFCTVDLKEHGEVIRHTIAQGGILRLVPPKKSEANVAATEKK
jgi:hypothetical protein